MLGLRTVIYRVENLTEAKEWYSKAFGTNPYFDEVFYVGFSIGGYELGLLPEEGEEGQKKGNNILAYWGTDDIEQSFRHFVDCGAEVHEAPNNVGGEVLVASVKDPWGNIIGIIYNPHFKKD